MSKALASVFFLDITPSLLILLEQTESARKGTHSVFSRLAHICLLGIVLYFCLNPKLELCWEEKQQFEISKIFCIVDTVA